MPGNERIGLFFLCHIFFQLYPWSDECGRDNTGQGVGWSHARSTDLVRWEFLPSALLPAKELNERLVASGSACIRGADRDSLDYTLNLL